MKIKDTDDGRGDLLPKERLFVNEYLKDFNGTQAIIRAGIKVKSPIVASGIASRYLQRERVQIALSHSIQKIQEKTSISVEMVIKELYRIATTDAKDAFDEKGNLLPIHKIPIDLRRAISSFEVETPMSRPGDKITKVKFWSKEKSLELLGKHLQMWIEKIQLSGDVNLIYGHRKPKGEEGK